MKKQVPTSDKLILKMAGALKAKAVEEAKRHNVLAI